MDEVTGVTRTLSSAVEGVNTMSSLLIEWKLEEVREDMVISEKENEPIKHTRLLAPDPRSLVRPPPRAISHVNITHGIFSSCEYMGNIL